jgi:phage shock protein E
VTIPIVQAFLHKEAKMFYNNNKVKSITPDQLNEKRRIGFDFFLLDVRTPAEYSVQSIPGSYLIPLQELQQRMQEIPKNKEIVVYCRVGNRSAYACTLLAREGFDAKNLEGGIQLWNTAESVSLTKAS